MARHGENIRKRVDGRWEGRYKAFDESKGGFFYRSVYGRDYGEAKEKLAMAKLGMVCHGAEKDLAAKNEIGNQNNADKNSGAVLFSQVAIEWLVEVSSKRKYSTCATGRRVYADAAGSCLPPEDVRQKANCACQSRRGRGSGCCYSVF